MKLALALVLAASPSLADRVRLGTDGDFRPNVWTETDGTLAGFEPHLADVLCPAAGLDCEWVVLPFDDLEPALFAHDIDAIFAGYARTPSRAQRMVFTASYLGGGTAGYFVLDGAVFGGPNGARVATQAGTWQAERAASDGAVVIGAESFAAAADALREGEADALLATRSWVAAEGPAGLSLWQEVHIPSGGAAIAFRPEDTALRDSFDSALANLASTGKLDALADHYFTDQ